MTILTAAAVLAEANRRADKRQVRELVRYPRIDGDRHIDATGTVHQIICVTPDLPYPDRILEFVILADDGSVDRIRTGVAYRGITPVG